MPSFGEDKLDRCRHELREHCIERHGLDPPWPESQGHRANLLVRPGPLTLTLLHPSKEQGFL